MSGPCCMALRNWPIERVMTIRSRLSPELTYVEISMDFRAPSILTSSASRASSALEIG